MQSLQRWSIGRRVAAIASILIVIIGVLAGSAMVTQWQSRNAVTLALEGLGTGQAADRARAATAREIATIDHELYVNDPDAAAATDAALAKINLAAADLGRSLADPADQQRIDTLRQGVTQYQAGVTLVRSQTADLSALEAEWQALASALPPLLDQLLKSRAESADADGARETAAAISAVSEGRRRLTALTAFGQVAGAAELAGLETDTNAARSHWDDVGTKVKRLQRNYGTGTGGPIMAKLSPAVEKGLEILSRLLPLQLERARQRAQSVTLPAAQIDAVLAELSAQANERTQNIANGLVGTLSQGVWLVLGFGLIGILLGIVMVAILVRNLVPPIRSLTDAMARLANKDLAVVVPGTDRGDELGRMAQALLVFRDSIAEADRLQTEQARITAETRARLLHELIDSFTRETGDAVSAVALAASTVNDNAAHVSRAVGSTDHQASAVSAATEQAARNVERVSAATQELTASIDQIGFQVQRSVSVADKAVVEASHTRQTVDTLRDAVSRIGDVVKLINQIAAQTNLLALNATIEAARAGDAGRGFAVVASEVKQLAQQTARATDDIQTQVATIQSQTGDAVSAIAHIGDIIRELSEMSTMAAAAVEQQGSATREIADSVEQMAAGMGTVSSSITHVAEQARTSGSAANEMLAAAEALNAHSSRLNQSIDGFIRRLAQG